MECLCLKKRHLIIWVLPPKSGCEHPAGILENEIACLSLFMQHIIGIEKGWKVMIHYLLSRKEDADSYATS